MGVKIVRDDLDDYIIIKETECREFERRYMDLVQSGYYADGAMLVLGTATEQVFIRAMAKSSMTLSCGDLGAG